MNRIVHFEIPVNDPEKSIRFYEKIFGWKFTRWGNEDYWMVETGPKDVAGINGGLMKRKDPDQPVVNTMEVEDMDAMIKKIESAGGKVVVPKNAIPGMGWLCYFKDPDGNIHGLMQNDPNAK